MNLNPTHKIRLWQLQNRQVSREGILRQRRELLPTVFTRQEVGRVLVCVHEDRFKAVLSLVYYCGLPLSEALQLKPEDIDSSR